MGTRPCTARGVMEHSARFLVVGDLVRKQTVIDEPSATYCLCKKLPLFGVWHGPKLVGFVHKNRLICEIYITIISKKEMKRKGKAQFLSPLQRGENPC